MTGSASATAGAGAAAADFIRLPRPQAAVRPVPTRPSFHCRCDIRLPGRLNHRMSPGSVEVCAGGVNGGLLPGRIKGRAICPHYLHHHVAAASVSNPICGRDSGAGVGARRASSRWGACGASRFVLGVLCIILLLGHCFRAPRWPRLRQLPGVGAGRPCRPDAGLAVAACCHRALAIFRPLAFCRFAARRPSAAALSDHPGCASVAHPGCHGRRCGAGCSAFARGLEPARVLGFSLTPLLQRPPPARRCRPDRPDTRQQTLPGRWRRAALTACAGSRGRCWHGAAGA